MVNAVASRAWGLSVGGVYMLSMGAADSLYVDPGRPCPMSAGIGSKHTSLNH